MSRIARRREPVTAKNANTEPPKKCRRCGSTELPVWVAADINHYVVACGRCFDSAAAWAAFCHCGAMQVDHIDGRCPLVAHVSEQRELPSAVPQLPPAPVRELEPIDAEEVPLDE